VGPDDDDDEWEPVYPRRWLKAVGLVVVVALVAPAVYIALNRLGLL
jgi:hypothetical protein